MDFERDFVAPLKASAHTQDPYEGWEWSVFQFDRLPSGVLHAAPASVENPTTWEEWYFEDGAMHHNILRNHAFDGEQKQVTLDDDEHPAIVMNIEWHYIDDKDHRPLYLR